MSLELYGRGISCDGQWNFVRKKLVNLLDRRKIIVESKGKCNLDFKKIRFKSKRSIKTGIIYE